MNRAFMLQLKLRWKLILTNRKLTFVMVFLPILLSLSVSLVFRDYSAIDRIPVALIDQDQTSQSGHLMNKLMHLESLDVEVIDPRHALAKLNNNQIEAIFTIKPGYEAMILSGEISDTVQVTFLESNMVASALGDIVAREIIEAFAVHSAGIKAERLLGTPDAKTEAMDLARSFIDKETFELELKTRVMAPGSSRETPENNHLAPQEVMRNRIVIGMILASTSFFMIFIGSATIEERRQAHFKRLKCAGQPRLTGAFLGFFTFTTGLLVIQFLVLSSLLDLFAVRNFIDLFLVLAGFSSSLCGLMIFAGIWFDKASVFQSMAAPAIFFICLAGGAFWSLELIPDQLLFFSQATPVYWTMESLMAMTYAGHVSHIPTVSLLLSGPLLSLYAEGRL